jgi:DNA-binding CsgD family transcriptional regulator
MDEAAGVGLKNGISFPAHTATGESAMFSIAIDGKFPQQLNNEVTPFGQLFTAYLHEAVRRVFSQKFLPISKVHLTPREQECLLWSADGKTTWEISQILNISERTVIYHIQNSTSKLGVANRQQAVARAITSGLINTTFQ